MKKVTKYWVQFWTTGAMFGEQWTVDLEKKTNPEDIEFPKNAYAFSLHKRTDLIDSKKTYNGKSEQIGKLYYHPDSKVTDINETKNHPNSSATLISNMRGNNWNKVVWTRWGNWPQPFDGRKVTILPA